MKCSGSSPRPATSRYRTRTLAFCPVPCRLSALTSLLSLQADLERELEHKEALLAQCMKREAEEVCGALAVGLHQALGMMFLDNV